MSTHPPESPGLRPPSSMVLWVALLASPVVWYAYFTGAFALAPLNCGHAATPVVLTAGALAILLIGAAGFFSWRRWRDLSTHPEAGQKRTLDNRRVMAWGGVALSGLFLIVTVAQFIPNLLIGGCE